MLYSNSSLTSNDIRRHFSSASMGGDELTAFSDADWNNAKLHLPTTGFIVFRGSNPISWACRTQRNTARSVGESEFISLSCCAQEL